ncbi:MAG: trimethylamine methyltransferase, partial [Alphaproteobacteria bacterium]|nr:trimethylamine methyltransferase [Alphaproteobacteria bacterium]
MAASEQGVRRGGRAARRAERFGGPIIQKRYITREIPVYELLDEAGIDLLHDTSMQILEEIGIDFRDEVALAQWKEAGADVKGERVHIPRELIAEKLAMVPAEYTQHARNPERNVVIGGKNTVFAPTFGSPFVRDFDNVRRYATLEDLQNFIKLTYMTPVLHHDGGIICEPIDVPVPKRHLDIVYSHIKFSDKPFMGVQSAPERAYDSCKMV